MSLLKAFSKNNYAVIVTELGISPENWCFEHSINQSYKQTHIFL